MTATMRGTIIVERTKGKGRHHRWIGWVVTDDHGSRSGSHAATKRGARRKAVRKLDLLIQYWVQQEQP